MSKGQFRGSIVALVTPMNETGAIEFNQLERLVEFHVENGTNAIISVGTTGESATLEPKEHIEVVRKTVEFAAGRIPVIAGTGANSTREAMELTANAAGVGADAALLVTPYYNKPTQEGLVQHHTAISRAVDLPQILYNVPGRTAVDMSNDTVNRIAELSNVVAIKDATGDIRRGKELIDLVSDRIDVLSGDDATAYELMLLGGKGNISVTANVAPAVMAEVCKMAIASNESAALEANNSVAELHNILFCESNPIPVKWALYEMGLIAQGIRLPLTPLAEQYRASLRAALENAGIKCK